MPEKLICPTFRAYRLTGKDQECIEEKCALWDPGIYDKYSPGCGRILRENRKV